MHRKRKVMIKIIVLGRQDAGKSTLVNKLIGQGILPVHLGASTPPFFTLSYGKSFLVQTINIKKEFENREKTHQFLEGLKETHAVKIQLPSNFLKDNRILIDSPGIDYMKKIHKSWLKRHFSAEDYILVYLFSRRGITNIDQDFFEEIWKLLKKHTIYFVLSQSGEMEKRDIYSVKESIRKYFRSEFRKSFEILEFPEILEVLRRIS